LEGPLVDIVLLGLLVTFFGIQQRSRPQLYFRLWFAGWLLVLASFVAWELRLVTPVFASIRNVIRLDSLLAGGLAFLLSFVVRQGRGRKTFWFGLSVAIPACALFQLSAAASPRYWLLFLFIFALQAALLHLTFSLLPREWKRRRITLSTLSLLFGFLMFTVARSEQHHDLVPWILGEIFLAAAVLFAGSANLPSIEWFVGTVGFSAWGLAYVVANYSEHNPIFLHLLYQLWNLPKYAVGFAMTLRIFAGARNDIVHLADRYKDLYGDFRLLYEHHPLPMWIYDASSMDFLSANAAATKSYGYSQDEFLNMKIEQIMRLPEVPSLHAPGAEAGESGSHRIGEEAGRVHHRRKDGSILAVELTEHDILFQGREARFVLAVDVTEREKLNQELFHRAQHDALTGLPNRLLLEDRIAQSLVRSSRENKKSVLFTMDVDRFKLINDTHGHLVGDETLKAISDRLRGRIRSVDTIARTGGEEFTAIIGGLNSAEDAEKIGAMFVRLFDTPLSLPNQELKVSISIGGAIYPDDATESGMLCKKSDQALYHAKRLGRNRFAFASREVCASFDQAMSVEMALREALKSDGFELFFQPIYDTDGRAVHFEALLRMKPRNAQVFDSALFMPVAEESGLIVPIGNWVVQEACRHLVQWRDAGRGRIGVGINVSGKQLLQKGFSSFVLETLAENRLPPAALQLELTETSLMAEPAFMRESMEHLAERGIRFAIDDFGTGYSSLARLADLPISLLKIDRSFIAQLEAVKRSEGIVTAIIQMAQTLDVQVVAEGVETESQLNLLLRRGCDLYQGNYLSPPLSPYEAFLAIEEKGSALYAHPHFSQTRVAVSKRVRRAAQLPGLVGVADGAA
jgi:diguanylate cyclase (GGDEF)-like protein/PAS domain S-box-containing protein